MTIWLQTISLASLHLGPYPHCDLFAWTAADAVGKLPVDVALRAGADPRPRSPAARLSTPIPTVVRPARRERAGRSRRSRFVHGRRRRPRSRRR